VYLLGTPSLEALFYNQGFHITEQEKPEMVVLGFDTTLTYNKLKQACLWIQKGVPWMATHPDLVCPSEEGDLPDCGAMAALIQKVTGKEAEIVLGKPHPFMIQKALERLGTQAEITAMVGDRLYTDMAMAKEGGLVSILVLTGETQKKDLETSPIQPDYIFNSVVQLAQEMD
ncbi:MAG: HAD family hydrolase, partial [Planctomycetota bacterium]